MTGQVIMMSAGRNQKALDSVPGEPHANGLFTWELTQVMQTPGIEIREALERVKDRVDDKAKGVGHEQRPGLVSDLRGNFYFFGPTTVQVQGDSTASDPETRTWDAAERVNSVESYQAYLNSYPKGRYVSAAKIAMAGLRQPAARPTPVPTRPTLAASDDPDTALWRAVESGNTTEDYGVYLKQYPKGKYVALAKQRSKRIEDDARAKAEAEEQADWQAAESAQTVESYLAYGARYPSGKYSFLAQTRASKLKNDTQAQAESQDWESARSANSAEAYNGYLARYPSGRYAALAKVAQQRLQRVPRRNRPVDHIAADLTARHSDRDVVLVQLKDIDGAERVSGSGAIMLRNDDGRYHRHLVMLSPLLIAGVEVWIIPARPTHAAA